MSNPGNGPLINIPMYKTPYVASTGSTLTLGPPVPNSDVCAFSALVVSTFVLSGIVYTLSLAGISQTTVNLPKENTGQQTPVCIFGGRFYAMKIIPGDVSYNPGKAIVCIASCALGETVTQWQEIYVLPATGTIASQYGAALLGVGFLTGIPFLLSYIQNTTGFGDLFCLPLWATQAIGVSLVPMPNVQVTGQNGFMSDLKSGITRMIINSGAPNTLSYATISYVSMMISVSTFVPLTIFGQNSSQGFSSINSAGAVCMLGLVSEQNNNLDAYLLAPDMRTEYQVQQYPQLSPAQIQTQPFNYGGRVLDTGGIFWNRDIWHQHGDNIGFSSGAYLSWTDITLPAIPPITVPCTDPCMNIGDPLAKI